MAQHKPTGKIFVHSLFQPPPTAISWSSCDDLVSVSSSLPSHSSHSSHSQHSHSQQQQHGSQHHSGQRKLYHSMKRLTCRESISGTAKLFSSRYTFTSSSFLGMLLNDVNNNQNNSNNNSNSSSSSPSNNQAMPHHAPHHHGIHVDPLVDDPPTAPPGSQSRQPPLDPTQLSSPQNHDTQPLEDDDPTPPPPPPPLPLPAPPCPPQHDQKEERWGHSGNHTSRSRQQEVQVQEEDQASAVPFLSGFDEYHGIAVTDKPLEDRVIRDWDERNSYKTDQATYDDNEHQGHPKQQDTDIISVVNVRDHMQATQSFPIQNKSSRTFPNNYPPNQQDNDSKDPIVVPSHRAHPALSNSYQNTPAPSTSTINRGRKNQKSSFDHPFSDESDPEENYASNLPRYNQNEDINDEQLVFDGNLDSDSEFEDIDYAPSFAEDSQVHQSGMHSDLPSVENIPPEQEEFEQVIYEDGEFYDVRMSTSEQRLDQHVPNANMPDLNKPNYANDISSANMTLEERERRLAVLIKKQKTLLEKQRKGILLENDLEEVEVVVEKPKWVRPSWAPETLITPGNHSDWNRGMEYDLKLTVFPDLIKAYVVRKRGGLLGETNSSEKDVKKDVQIMQKRYPPHVNVAALAVGKHIALRSKKAGVPALWLKRVTMRGSKWYTDKVADILRGIGKRNFDIRFHVDFYMRHQLLGKSRRPHVLRSVFVMALEGVKIYGLTEEDFEIMEGFAKEVAQRNGGISEESLAPSLQNSTSSSDAAYIKAENSLNKNAILENNPLILTSTLEEADPALQQVWKEESDDDWEEKLISQADAQDGAMGDEIWDEIDGDETVTIPSDTTSRTKDGEASRTLGSKRWISFQNVNSGLTKESRDDTMDEYTLRDSLPRDLEPDYPLAELDVFGEDDDMKFEEFEYLKFAKKRREEESLDFEFKSYLRKKDGIEDKKVESMGLFSYLKELTLFEEMKSNNGSAVDDTDLETILDESSESESSMEPDKADSNRPGETIKVMPIQPSSLIIQERLGASVAYTANNGPNETLPIIYAPSNRAPYVPIDVDLEDMKIRVFHSPVLRNGKDTSTWYLGLHHYLRPVFLNHKIVCYIVKAGAGVVARVDSMKEEMMKLNEAVVQHMGSDALYYTAGAVIGERAKELEISEAYCGPVTFEERQGNRTAKLAIFLSAAAKHGLKIRFNVDKHIEELKIPNKRRRDLLPSFLNMIQNGVQVWEMTTKDFDLLKMFQTNARVEPSPSVSGINFRELVREASRQDPEGNISKENLVPLLIVEILRPHVVAHVVVKARQSISKNSSGVITSARSNEPGLEEMVEFMSEKDYPQACVTGGTLALRLKANGINFVQFRSFLVKQKGRHFEKLIALVRTLVEAGIEVDVSLSDYYKRHKIKLSRRKFLLGYFMKMQEAGANVDELMRGQVTKIKRLEMLADQKKKKIEREKRRQIITKQKEDIFARINGESMVPLLEADDLNPMSYIMAKSRSRTRIIDNPLIMSEEEVKDPGQAKFDQDLVDRMSEHDQRITQVRLLPRVPLHPPRLMRTTMDPAAWKRNVPYEIKINISGGRMWGYVIRKGEGVLLRAISNDPEFPIDDSYVSEMQREQRPHVFGPVGPHPLQLGRQLALRSLDAGIDTVFVADFTTRQTKMIHEKMLTCIATMSRHGLQVKFHIGQYLKKHKLGERSRIRLMTYFLLMEERGVKMYGWEPADFEYIERLRTLREVQAAIKKTNGINEGWSRFQHLDNDYDDTPSLEDDEEEEEVGDSDYTDSNGDDFQSIDDEREHENTGTEEDIIYCDDDLDLGHSGPTRNASTLNAPRTIDCGVGSKYNLKLSRDAF